MGNVLISPYCCINIPISPTSGTGSIKLVFWEGMTKILTGNNHIAGELMFQFPDMMVCHADSFFIGQPVPSLSIDDKLISGETYFVLPIDRFACKLLSASLLSALSSAPKPSPIKFGDCPFQYVKGGNGKVQIKVQPDFIKRLILMGNEKQSTSTDGISCNGSSPNNNNFLCSTPELQKHYNQLVGSKEQVWSPRLETISERKTRPTSPCGFPRLEWRSSAEVLEG
ncbi:hypothetical protein Scep_013908 [Stephania cephalantha]|uniref:Uncharacterized protein n=1 Tax=Stephania cephalantha TaxID=152367 RepID=A0AAP0NYW3_9MAGN